MHDYRHRRSSCRATHSGSGPPYWFSESALRYYERIGLIDPVPRDSSSSHRRYAAETVDTLEALACLRSTGMSIDDMRAYLDGVAGRAR